MFYWVAKYTLGVALKLVFRPWSRGRRNLPRRGPVILASNHLSFADHFFGPLPLPRKVVFLAKSEYFTGKGIKGLASRAFFSGVGQIPIDRTGGEASERALRSGLRVLAEGKVLGIYPEGTRSPDGRLYRGRTGVARLALESRAPVVPCAMMHTFEFLPSGLAQPEVQRQAGGDLRQADGVLPVLRQGDGPRGAARGHRRDHGRDREAVRPGIRQHLREAGERAAEGGEPLPAEPTKAGQPGTDSSMLSIAARAFARPALQERYGRLGFAPCEWESLPAAATARD